MKSDFPIFDNMPPGRRLSYLDSGASAHPHRKVLEGVMEYYTSSHSNIHRGVHFLAEAATERYEKARSAVRSFVNAEPQAVVAFTSGTTQAMNFVAEAFLKPRLQSGDIVAASPLEHHSNYLPWLKATKAAGAELQACSLEKGWRIDPESIPWQNPRLKMVAVTHVSNVTGGIQPVEEICRLGQKHGVPVAVDGAQAAAHISIDFSAIGASFYAFSGHKMYALTGIGALIASPETAKATEHAMVGGGMVESISNGGYTTLPPPAGWEAGTPNIAGAVSLGLAADFVASCDPELRNAHTRELLAQARAALESTDDMRIIMDEKCNAGIISFSHKSIHPHDMAALLSERGVCVRAGHHCAKPFMEHIGEKAVCRLSLACYNDAEDIKQFAGALAESIKYFNEP